MGKSDNALRAAGGVKKKTVKKGTPTAAGIEFHKSKGQHILRNPMVVQSIVDKAGIKATDTVLEIGPGTGNLTMKLLERAKQVIAVELDPRMVLELTRRVQGTPWENNLKVVHCDFLKAELPYFDLCVANIPYNISSPLTFKLLAHRPAFRAAIIMYQHEFAMRLVARPGDNLFCRLSANTQLLARVSHLLKVGKNNFRPPPKVDSSVVRIEPRHPPPPVNFKEWDGLTRLCFGRKNRTIGAVFKQNNTLCLLEANFRTLMGIRGGQQPQASPSRPAQDGRPEPISIVVMGDDADCDMDPDASDNDDDVDMQVDNSKLGKKRGRNKVTPEFRAKVMAVLEKSGLEEKRAAKLTQEEFLLLLAHFNAADIHFA